MASRLPAPKRYLTTHDQATGKAVISKAFEPEVEGDHKLPGFALWNVYSSNSFPVDVNGDVDLPAYAADLPSMPALEKEGGVVYRIIDVLPGFGGIMHRTLTLDVGVVMEGEIELVLDSGETQVLKKGDVIVQRGTMHAWKNTTDEIARIFFVLSQAKPVTVRGEEMGLVFPVEELFTEERLIKAGMKTAE